MPRTPTERNLAPHGDTIYALFRLVFGLLFWFHGGQKLFGWFGGGPEHLNTLMLVAGLIEFGAGALVAVGCYASPAAFLASGEMAVASELSFKIRDAASQADYDVVAEPRDGPTELLHLSGLRSEELELPNARD